MVLGRYEVVNRRMLLKLLITGFLLKAVLSVDTDAILKRQNSNQWFKDGKAKIREILKIKDIVKKAKGAILTIGDGMGPSTVTAARILDGQNKGMTGEENILSWEKFPNVGLSKTYNTDSQVSDSAGTATAYHTGVKARRAVIGVDEEALYANCLSSKNHEVLSLYEMAEMAGLSTGVITTTRVTHASPAATYAHSASRNWEAEAPDGCKDIASFIVDPLVGDGLEVILGGGRQMFLPNDTADPEYPTQFGKRKDKRNLIQEWQDKSKAKKDGKYEYVWNNNQFKKLDAAKVDHIMGLFEPSHMNWEYERLNSTSGYGEPSLAEMAEFAVKVLQKNPKGFVLFVEGGRIDLAHHANRPQLALTEAVHFSEAVAKLDDITKEDEVTLITSADHSHVFTMGGYQTRGNPIFNLVNKGSETLDKKNYTTLGYTNGPGAPINKSREDPEKVFDFNNKLQRYQSLVPLESETHGGEDVGIYARGPQSHLIRGVLEQNVIFHVMDYALCLSESAKAICIQEGIIADSKDNAGPYMKSNMPIVLANILIGYSMINVLL